MTARQFLMEYAGWEGNLKEGLSLLSEYVGKNMHYYVHFPDAEVTTEEGDVLAELPDEPAGFQSFCRARHEDDV